MALVRSLILSIFNASGAACAALLERQDMFASGELVSLRSNGPYDYSLNVASVGTGAKFAEYCRLSNTNDKAANKSTWAPERSKPSEKLGLNTIFSKVVCVNGPSIRPWALIQSSARTIGSLSSLLAFYYGRARN